MYRKKRRSWTKHVDFMLLDVLCMQLAFVISYIIRFGTDNPYTDGDYRTLAIAFLLSISLWKSYQILSKMF